MTRDKDVREAMYKMSEELLIRLYESRFISMEEYQKIRLLNIDTFAPELSCLYV